MAKKIDVIALGNDKLVLNKITFADIDYANDWIEFDLGNYVLFFDFEEDFYSRTFNDGNGDYEIRFKEIVLTKFLFAINPYEGGDNPKFEENRIYIQDEEIKRLLIQYASNLENDLIEQLTK